jgi:hypothetical protein
MHAANGRGNTKERSQTRCKLTAGEESALADCIRLLTSWLQPPRHVIVEDIGIGLLLLREVQALLG